MSPGTWLGANRRRLNWAALSYATNGRRWNACRKRSAKCVAWCLLLLVSFSNCEWLSSWLIGRGDGVVDCWGFVCFRGECALSRSERRQCCASRRRRSRLWILIELVKGFHQSGETARCRRPIMATRRAMKQKIFGVRSALLAVTCGSSPCDREQFCRSPVALGTWNAHLSGARRSFAFDFDPRNLFTRGDANGRQGFLRSRGRS